MCSDVNHEIVLLGEPSWAEIAFVRFFASVCTEMHLKLSNTFESLIAVIASMNNLL